MLWACLIDVDVLSCSVGVVAPRFVGGLVIFVVVLLIGWFLWSWFGDVRSLASVFIVHDDRYCSSALVLA